MRKEDIEETGVLNLFSGYKYEPLEEKVDDEYFDDIKPVLKHLYEVLCNSNDKIYDYVVKWLAHLLQKPWDKSGVPTILMKSDEGTGKNLFWEFVGDALGQRYFTLINDLDDLTNKFNAGTEGKLLTLLNEIQNYGGNFKSNDKLKSILTDPIQRIEPKGKEAYLIKNFQDMLC